MDCKSFLFKNIPSDARKPKVNSSKWFGLQIIVANSISLTLIVNGISVTHESDDYSLFLRHIFFHFFTPLIMTTYYLKCNSLLTLLYILLLGKDF